MNTKKVLISFVNIICISVAAFGSNNYDPGTRTVDSLRALVESGDLNTRYAALIELAFEFADSDNQTAIGYAGEALAIADATRDTVKIIKSNRIIGQLKRRMGENRPAIRYLLRAFNLAARIDNQNEMLWVSNSLGIGYAGLGKYDSALFYYYKALRKHRRDDSMEGVGVLLNNIGLLYYNMGDINEATGYFDQSLAAYTQVDAHLNMATACFNQSLCYARMGSFSLATSFLQRGVALCDGRCTPYQMLNKTYAEGELRRQQGMFGEAVPLFHESFKQAHDLSDAKFEIDSRLGTAKCLAIRRQRDEALQHLYWCEQRARVLKLDQALLNIYEDMVPLLEDSGDVSRLSQVQKRFIETKDRVFNDQVVTRVAMARVEYEENENLDLIARQSEILDLNEEAIARQRLLISISFGFGILVVALAIVLFRLNRLQRRISNELDKRVFERTRELEVSERNLVTAFGEQKAVMEMISEKVLSSIATLRGLWMVRGHSPADRDIAEFDKAATDLLQVPRIINRSVGMRIENFVPSIHRQDAYPIE